MVTKPKGPKRTGKFFISPDKEIYGELTLAGGKSSLYLHQEDHFEARGLDCFIKGILFDQTKVSLIDCIGQVAGSRSSGHGRYYFANLFPHFVIHGDHHISPRETAIAAVYFRIDDANTLFYDFDAFGYLTDARPFIGQIAHANTLNRQITTGPNPEILYFTGKREIFTANTALGRVSSSHRPSPSFGSSRGVSLKNRIVVSIAFQEEIDFHEAIFRSATLCEYMGLLVGRPQNLRALNIQVAAGGQEPTVLKVYWSTPPMRNKSDELEKTQSMDVLLDAVRHPEEFSSVLTRWVSRGEEWRDARFRFFNSFAKQQRYDIDRLTGSANMFDVLPAAATPPDVELADELQNAKKCAKLTFGRLPASPERDSVLGTLGRLGKSSLKQKVRDRAQRLTDAAEGLFPQLLMVTDEAVNCRNYYVHGGEPRFDYNRNFDAVIFFTETLEFVFATSDLIEAGWGFKAWSKAGTTMSHPFGRYLVTYATQIKRLGALLSRIGQSA